MSSSSDSRPPAAPPVTSEQLHALVDGRLAPAEHAALLRRVQDDAALHATYTAWRAQRDALRGLHAGVLAEPVPDGQRLAAERAGQAGRVAAPRPPWTRWAGMAAAVLLAFTAGWAVRGLAPQGAAVLAGAPPSQFVRQASVAHLVYAPEVRHPVEVTAAQQEHLVQWLSKRLGRPLKLPSLAAQGFELVGGRLLPGEQGARAQFMYQDAAGLRVTLYLGAVAANAAGGPTPDETAFRLSAEPVPSFYWVDQGFGYALAGQMPTDRLLDLARAVHAQL
ncbi:anti-sigma factor family protein [Pseudorhodoferax sp.]|uniref:anti-sigma factor family protein n=1 Tax=Pseudorhodoferax sp. TaxID=1993553 RepID=UPI002DD68338|nr:anti-sigma factor [Pseudorhodoferax sp.]